MKTKVDKEIIGRIQARRIQKKMSKRTLASIIGTHHSFPGQVEDMDSPCKYSADQLYYIAQDFGCPVSEFFPSADAFPPKNLE